MQGPETEKSHKTRIENGFYEKYMSGTGLDIGYKGSVQDADPVLPTAIGVDFDYPGYDGKTLPFADESQDYVFSSHCLEHIEDYEQAIKEWYRVLKIGGYLIVTVPHKDLYEKKLQIPSQWNADHKRFYEACDLLIELYDSLETNSYRIVHLRDNDDNFDYTIPANQHSGGCYEIELVIKKITRPEWSLI